MYHIFTSHLAKYPKYFPNFSSTEPPNDNMTMRKITKPFICCTPELAPVESSPVFFAEFCKILSSTCVSDAKAVCAATWFSTLFALRLRAATPVVARPIHAAIFIIMLLDFRRAPFLLIINYSFCTNYLAEIMLEINTAAGFEWRLFDTSSLRWTLNL